MDWYRGSRPHPNVPTSNTRPNAATSDSQNALAKSGPHQDSACCDAKQMSPVSRTSRSEQIAATSSPQQNGETSDAQLTATTSGNSMSSAISDVQNSKATSDSKNDTEISEHQQTPSISYTHQTTDTDQKPAAPVPNRNSPSSAVHHSSSVSNPTLKQQVRKAFRMILLISGTFWGTYFPGNIVFAAAFLSGYNWEDINDRSHMTLSIIMRVNVYILPFVSPVVSPLIYYYSRRDLRVAFCKMVGWKCTRAT